MSYLEKLIDRATDTNLDLENNQIGNYSITPQHGVNVIQYHIYKNEEHCCSFDIVGRSVIIRFNTDILSHDEIQNIDNVLHNLYCTYEIEKTTLKNPYKLEKYWHVIKTNNSISVDSFKSVECKDVKNSIASFTKREFAIEHANTKQLK